MDLFQKNFCQKLLPREVEIEMEVDTETIEGPAEVEEMQVNFKETIDIQAIYNELDYMKKRIQLLQAHLKTKIVKYPETESVDPKLLASSKTKKLHALQNRQHKLQCHVKNLNKCFHISKSDIKDLHSRISDISQDVLELQKIVASLIAWGNTLENEFGKCSKPFEHLEQGNAAFQGEQNELNNQDKRFDKMDMETIVPEVYFMKEKQSFAKACKNTQKMLNEMLQFQLDRYSTFQQVIHDTNRNNHTTNIFNYNGNTNGYIYGNANENASSIDVKHMQN